MTANQIAYQNMLESKRSNVAKETETQRHNIRNEDIDSSKLSETARHNLSTEGLESKKQSETKRHNIAQEFLSGTEIHQNYTLKDRELNDKYAIAQMQNETNRRGQDFKLGGDALKAGMSLGASLVKVFA